MSNVLDPGDVYFTRGCLPPPPMILEKYDSMRVKVGGSAKGLILKDLFQRVSPPRVRIELGTPTPLFFAKSAELFDSKRVVENNSTKECGTY
jgi:hypothetical protein